MQKLKLNCIKMLTKTFNIEQKAKVIEISSKSMISPKIVINKKNYVFKEAIEQLNKDRQGTRRIYLNDDLPNQCEELSDSQKLINQYKNRQDIASFNPFEIAGNSDVENNNFIKSDKHRSNSDIISCGGFLNRVEVSNENNHGRRSDIAHYSKPGLNITKQYSLDAKSIKSGKVSNSKLSVDTFSNKNSSNNNENSILSYEVTNSGRISDSK